MPVVAQNKPFGTRPFIGAGPRMTTIRHLAAPAMARARSTLARVAGMNRESWIRQFVGCLRTLGTNVHPDVLEEIASDFFEVEGEQDPVMVAQDHASDWSFPPLGEDTVRQSLNERPM